eukprot:PhM_4_TR12483/c0_g1_i1/m.570/K12869/CRN, CRNKL1, CLF1, SYF3; crooked neck
MKRGRGRLAGEAQDKGVANVQLTAEQLLSEASELAAMSVAPTSSVAQQNRSFLSDPAEIEAYCTRKREEFEKKIRSSPNAISAWTRYIDWERQQNEFSNVRSIFERLIQVMYQHTTVWQRYAEFEASSGMPAHAVNVYERALKQLPRAEALWYRWALLMETRKDHEGTRRVFNQWTESYTVPHAVWENYVEMEMRFKDVAAARDVCSRYVVAKNDTQSWTYYAKFEEGEKEMDLCAKVFAAALEAVPTITSELILSYAAFATRNGMYSDAQSILHRAASTLSDVTSRDEVMRALVAYERSHGNSASVLRVIQQRARIRYQLRVDAERDKDTAPKKSKNISAVEGGDDDSGAGLCEAYLSWLIFELRSYRGNDDAEGAKQQQAVKELFERAVVDCKPNTKTNSVSAVRWYRYAYLYIIYAVFVETNLNDVRSAADVMRRCVESLPHGSIGFARVWLTYAETVLRQGAPDVSGYRQVMGAAVGTCAGHDAAPVLRHYISIESALREADRVRKLYEKWISVSPNTSEPWISYAAYEASLGERERADAIYKLIIGRIATLSDPTDVASVWTSALKHFASDVSQAREVLSQRVEYELTSGVAACRTLFEWAAYEEHVATDLPAAARVLSRAVSLFGSLVPDVMTAVREFEMKTGKTLREHCGGDSGGVVVASDATDETATELAKPKKKLKLFNIAAAQK